MSVFDRFFGAFRATQMEEKGKAIVFGGGAYWLEPGPIRKQMTISQKFLDDTGMSLDQALRHHKLRVDYVPNGFDASVPPRRIRVDEPFRYTDYSDKAAFVWKFYKRVDGVLQPISEMAVSREEAIEAAKQFIKKDA